MLVNSVEPPQPSRWHAAEQGSEFIMLSKDALMQLQQAAIAGSSRRADSISGAVQSV
jgi:hypothetical protein